MKNICIFDTKTKYAYIIKSFLITFQCRVTICNKETDAYNKLSIGVYDGLIIIETFPESLLNLITNLYENHIVLFYIGSIKKDKLSVDYHLIEPFSLLEFAILIKNFIDDIKKRDCLYYIIAKKENQSINCILENPTYEGGIIYPMDSRVYNVNIFNNFFRNIKGEFEIDFLYSEKRKSVLAKPLFYEYTPGRIIKEVYINFMCEKEEMKKIFI